MRTRLITTVALLASALVGCTDPNQTKPSPWPSPPASTPVSQSPTPQAPTPQSPTPQLPTEPILPDIARGILPASSKAFVRHWVAVLNYAMVTGDTKQLRDLSQPKCGSCMRLARKIERIYRAGGSAETQGWRVASLKVRNLSDLAGVVHVSELSVHMSKSSPKRDDKAFKTRLHFLLQRLDSGWSMWEVEQLA